MKAGLRKTSPNKRLKARTSAQAKRAVKRAVVPGYGQKGSGIVKSPRRAAYNRVYQQTTRSLPDALDNRGAGTQAQTVQFAATEGRQKHEWEGAIADFKDVFLEADLDTFPIIQDYWEGEDPHTYYYQIRNQERGNPHIRYNQSAIMKETVQPGVSRIFNCYEEQDFFENGTEATVYLSGTKGLQSKQTAEDANTVVYMGTFVVVVVLLFIFFKIAMG